MPGKSRHRECRLFAVGNVLPLDVNYLLLNCITCVTLSIVQGLGGGYGDILECDVFAFVGIYLFAAARCDIALLAVCAVGVIHAAEGIAYALTRAVYKECCPYQCNDDRQYYKNE